MGHLIKILRHITNCISESEHIAALIASSFGNESDLQLWQSLIDAEEGEFTLAVAQQNKLLANCNPHEDNEYSADNSKDFLGETNAWDIGATSYSNVCYSDLDNTLQDVVFTIDNDQSLFQFGRNIDDDDDDDDEHGGSSGDGHNHGMFTKNSTTLNNLAADAWDMDVQFADMTGVCNTHPNVVNAGTSSWGSEFNSDNFADFDAHFSTFSSDLGMPHTQAPLNDAAQSTSNSSEQIRTLNEDDVSMTATTNNQQSIINDDDQQAEYDNNANVEKAASDKLNDVDASATTAAAAATSIVSRLQSVLLAGEDDYEDDEGMWTKPLGGSNQSETMATDQQSTLITNGPSKIAEL